MKVMDCHPLWLLPVLTATGFVAGWLGAITGAGGLIALPALLAVGVPAQLALGTNMLQSSVGTVAAALTFLRLRTVSFTGVRSGVFSVITGAAVGVVAIHHVPAQDIRNLLPAVLLALVILLVLAPRAGIDDVAPRVPSTAFHLTAGFSLGFLDGSIGAGAGTLWAAAFVGGLGFNLSKATAHAKVMNAISNVTAFSLFLTYGSVWLLAGFTMGLGQLFGGVLGAKQVTVRGAAFVRPVYLAAVVALLLRLVLWP